MHKDWLAVSFFLPRFLEKRPAHTSTPLRNPSSARFSSASTSSPMVRFRTRTSSGSASARRLSLRPGRTASTPTRRRLQPPPPRTAKLLLLPPQSTSPWPRLLLHRLLHPSLCQSSRHRLPSRLLSRSPRWRRTERSRWRSMRRPRRTERRWSRTRSTSRKRRRSSRLHLSRLEDSFAACSSLFDSPPYPVSPTLPPTLSSTSYPSTVLLPNLLPPSKFAATLAKARFLPLSRPSILDALSPPSFAPRRLLHRQL